MDSKDEVLMRAYKVAWYGWFGFAVAAVAFQRPLYAILPTVYMPIVGLILYKKYRDMTYADIYSTKSGFASKLNLANLMFVVLNGAAIAQIERYFYPGS